MGDRQDGTGDFRYEVGTLIAGAAIGMCVFSPHPWQLAVALVLAAIGALLRGWVLLGGLFREKGE